MSLIMVEKAPYDVIFLDKSWNGSCPIPTPHDIDGSEPLLHECTGSYLVRKFERFVIKYGWYVYPIEARNMQYVAKSTTVPVPRVYAVYQDRKKQGLVTYIVMDYVPGQTLLKLWNELDSTRKTAIAMKLRAYFDELRALQHPGYFGSLDGGLPLDGVFGEDRDSDEITKSCSTEEEVIDRMLRGYSLATGERTAHKVRYYQHVLPVVLRGNGSPVFSHSDFQRKNIMIRPEGLPIIIDWEFASWCPSYWDYSTAIFCNGGWHDDWQEYLRMVLDEHPNQSLWLSTLKLEMWS